MASGSDQNTPPTTGAAMSRRVRRRRLADAFEREERTFGPDTDPERMERFLERGRKTGGAARRLAEEGEASIGMALPWPIHRGHLDVEAWTEVQNLSLENGTQLWSTSFDGAIWTHLVTKTFPGAVPGRFGGGQRRMGW